MAGTSLIPAGGSCLVAVSGGLDSMVMLEGLVALAPGHGWRLLVAHFNHRLRGEESDGDQRFVEQTAHRLGLGVVCESLEVADSVQPGDSLEAVARHWRHAFLARAARDHGCDRIAMGHHADDQTELFLMRFLRGSGGAGLSGMSATDPSPADAGLVLVRPLLGFRRSRLGSAAADLGWRFRVDASNADPAFLRNRVRHELIPWLRERYQPALEKVVAREQSILREQALAVESWADAWLADPRGVAFEGLVTAVQRDVVRLQLERMRVAPGFDLIEALRCGAGRVIQVDAGRRIVRDPGGRVGAVGAGHDEPVFRFEEEFVELAGDGGMFGFGGIDVGWTARVGEGVAGIAGSGEVFDADSVGPSIRVRHWRPGDRFQPIGLGASAKLQDLFTNARVPAGERRGRVLAETSGGEIFWVEGLRVGEVAKVTDGTRRRLGWTWRRVGSA